MIARLTDTPIDDVARAVGRAQKRGLGVEIRQRGQGFVRAVTECRGGCGMAHLLNARHDVVLWADTTMSCDCPSREFCYHAGAVIEHEGGAIPAAADPAKPKDYPDGDPRCMNCGARFTSVNEAVKHSRLGVHAVQHFKTTERRPAVEVAPLTEPPGDGVEPLPPRGPALPKRRGWRTKQAAQPLVDLEHERRRRVLKVVP